MNPKRVQMTRQRPWRQEHPDAVIVARPSRWGNPFRVGHRYLKFHDLGWGIPAPAGLVPGVGAAVGEVVQIADRAEAVEMYRAWVRSCVAAPTLTGYEDLTPLRGRDLACWCPAGEPCHADVLLELANGAPS